MTEPAPRPSLTPIYDQLLREQEQPTPCDDQPDDTGPDQPAGDSPSAPPS